MVSSAVSIPDPGKTPFAALRDALRYPLGEAALLTNVVLIGCQLLALVLPVLGLPLQVLTWFWLYKYGLEALTATGAGRADPPEGWSEVEDGLHRRHFWLQVLLMVALLAATHLAPQYLRAWLVAALAVILPATVLSLAVAQNLIAALNPLSWLRVMAQIGPAYLLLALATSGVLWLQVSSGRLLDGLQPHFVAIIVYYAIAQHLTLSLFRLFGQTLHAHANALGFRDDNPTPSPRATRDRDETAKREWGEQALQETDPAKRAAMLALLLPRGVPDELHREYRQCLRHLGDAAALREHARVRTCELLALGQSRSAVSLAVEAMAEDASFALPDAASSLSLSLAAEQIGLVRQAAQILANYRQENPRRYDGLPLALRAAALFANRLQESEAARRLLRAAQPMAAPGEESDTFRQAIDLLATGKSLPESIPESR